MPQHSSRYFSTPAIRPGVGYVAAGLLHHIRRSAWRWIIAAAFLSGVQPIAQAAEGSYDVVIYGGTSAGVIAAVQCKALGRSVLLVNPAKRLGGLSSGGLGQTDIGNKQAIGGLSREFYVRLSHHYAQTSAWSWQPRDEYKGRGQSATEHGESAQWTFEPHVAEKIFEDLVRENGIMVLREERLDLKHGVEKSGARIIAIRLESGIRLEGRMFIDTTYEGDLMAKAGVSYHVGREANRLYGETYNGVQVKNSTNHNLVPGVDPYVRRGDSSSGLLPGIDPEGPGTEGEGDKRLQAFCFRMCLTDHPENRIPFAKPADYDEAAYELLLRNFEAGETITPWINSPMPNRKTDTNNRRGVSTDYIGQNYDYADANYITREHIVRRHLSYQQGLMWTLANHPRVPEAIRNEVSRWGLTRDEFKENGGWPEQLYIREARRMVGAYVMTQHNCEGREVVPDGVGLAAYTMDSHNTRRFVDSSGQVRNEGNIEVRGFPPYPISYRSITPKATECENLLVPVCLSSSHIAFGSIRMEPVFMVLGQSAAFAADLALAQGTKVQAVDYPTLRTRLLAAGQVITWPISGQPPASTP